MKFGWFLIGFLAFAVAERVYERRFSHRAVRGIRKMEWSFAAFHTLHVVVFAATAAEYFWLERSINWAVTGIGLALFVVSVVVRLTAIRALGQFWSLHLEIRDEHPLVTTGIYRYMRHPAYSAIMLEIISIPLVGNAYVTLVVALCLYAPLLLVRWVREEQEMVRKFGQQYEQYRKEVPAFFPWHAPARPMRSGAA